eukprot:3304876-Rhodomonas_salina.5
MTDMQPWIGAMYVSCSLATRLLRLVQPSTTSVPRIPYQPHAFTVPHISEDTCYPSTHIAVPSFS